jgi:RNA polymerase sigma-70 factor (ECF subfamily)
MDPVSTLRPAILARVSDALARELAGLSDLDARLDAIVRAGRDASPDLHVARHAWAAYLASHLHEGDAARQLADLHAADVHLALACASGNELAHARLDARLRAASGQALAGIRLGRLSRDEVLQAVRTKLLVGDDGLGKLSTYSGRGPLDGWLRVTLARTALSLRRVRDPEAAREDEPDVLVNLAASDDPQLAALRSRCAPTLKHAIEEAVAALPAEDRTLLHLHVVDGLTIDDLAAVYRAHRATLARRLARTRNAIFEGSRARATAALGLDDAEFASLMGVMMSRLDLTLGRALEDGRS